jgi:hypothetical protein
MDSNQMSLIQTALQLTHEKIFFKKVKADLSTFVVLSRKTHCSTNSISYCLDRQNLK